MKSADRSEYVAELATLKQDWEEKFAGRRDSDRFPFTSQCPLGALAVVEGEAGGVGVQVVEVDSLELFCWGCGDDGSGKRCGEDDSGRARWCRPVRCPVR